jgi:hypothetical protein
MLSCAAEHVSVFDTDALWLILITSQRRVCS